MVSMSDVTGIGVVIMRDNDVVSPMGYVSGNGHISTSTITTCMEGQDVYVKVKLLIFCLHFKLTLIQLD